MNTDLTRLGDYLTRMGRGEVPYDLNKVRTALNTIEKDNKPEWILSCGTYWLRESTDDRTLSVTCSVSEDAAGRWVLHADFRRTSFPGGASGARRLAVEWCKRLGVIPIDGGL